jgi:acetoin utilization deacetylase AcuC-like enzyme
MLSTCLCLFLLSARTRLSFALRNIPLIITSKAFLEHSPPFPHPECPARISSLFDRLDVLCAQKQIFLRPPTAFQNEEESLKSLNVIKNVHDNDYIRHIKHSVERGKTRLSTSDHDTYINNSTFLSCIYAQSAWINAVDYAVVNRSMAFSVSRPPGHHALFSSSMGFCIFNFAVGAATYALQHHNLKRVGIVDFDVHYGNGIAELIKDNPRIRYVSLHQEGIFPHGQGGRNERGNHNNILNVPLPAGIEGKEYTSIFRKEAIPFIKEFQPELVIVSAGYDALQSDPLAQVCHFGLFFLVLFKFLFFGIKAVVTTSRLSRTWKTFTRKFRRGCSFRVRAVAFFLSFPLLIFFCRLEGGYNTEDVPRAILETIRAFH